MESFIVEKIKGTSVIIRKGKEYTAVVQSKTIYQSIVVGKSITYDETKIDEKYKNYYSQHLIRKETEKAVFIEIDNQEFIVPKQFGIIATGCIYLTDYTVNNLKPTTSKEDWKEAFKATYHSIKGAHTNEDGSVDITFKVLVKDLNEIIERTETFKPDYCQNGKVLGNIILGANYSYISDEQLVFVKGQNAFKWEINQAAIDTYLNTKSDPTKWENEDTQKNTKQEMPLPPAQEDSPSDPEIY